MASNSFGNIFKFTSFGESHGKAIGCIVDGVPPLISIEEKDIQYYLDRRKPGLRGAGGAGGKGGRAPTAT